MRKDHLHTDVERPIEITKMDIEQATKDAQEVLQEKMKTFDTVNISLDLISCDEKGIESYLIFGDENYKLKIGG